jgi:hypothetical protein
MDWIVVEGLKPWEGRYEFDLGGQPPTIREWGWLKRLTGYMPLTLDQGFDGGDPELYACFAVLAIRRAGKIDDGGVVDLYERLIDNPFEQTIRLEFDQDKQEPEEDPTLPPSSSENGSSSGHASTPNLANWDLPRPRTGTPDSATSESDQPTQVT